MSKKPLTEEKEQQVREEEEAGEVEHEVVQEDGQPPVVVRSGVTRPSRLTVAYHASSSSHLIDVLPAASMPATALSSNPTRQPITAERAVPSDLTAATGH